MRPRPPRSPERVPSIGERFKKRPRAGGVSGPSSSSGLRGSLLQSGKRHRLERAARDPVPQNDVGDRGKRTAQAMKCRDTAQAVRVRRIGSERTCGGAVQTIAAFQKVHFMKDFD